MGDYIESIDKDLKNLDDITNYERLYAGVDIDQSVLYELYDFYAKEMNDEEYFKIRSKIK